MEMALSMAMVVLLAIMLAMHVQDWRERADLRRRVERLEGKVSHQYDRMDKHRTALNEVSDRLLADRDILVGLKGTLSALGEVFGAKRRGEDD